MYALVTDRLGNNRQGHIEANVTKSLPFRHRHFSPAVAECLLTGRQRRAAGCDVYLWSTIPSFLESAVKQFEVDKDTILSRGSLVSIFVMPVALTALCLFALGIKFFGPQAFDDMTCDLED